VPTTADQNSALQQTATPTGVIEDADTIRGLLQPVYFDFDRSNVKADERAKLQAAKDYLDKNPQYRLLLEGHCDWRGTAEYNLGLGDRRASEAKKYLLRSASQPTRSRPSPRAARRRRRTPTRRRWPRTAATSSWSSRSSNTGQDTLRGLDALPHDVEIEALVGGVKVVLGQEQPEHDRVEPRHRLMSAMIGTLPPSRRYRGGRPHTAVTAASVARKARARTGDWSFGVLGRPGGTTT
jgi:hypothetical protein